MAGEHMGEQRCSFIATDYNAININKSYERARVKATASLAFIMIGEIKIWICCAGQSTGSLKALRSADNVCDEQSIVPCSVQDNGSHGLLRLAIQPRKLYVKWCEEMANIVCCAQAHSSAATFVAASGECQRFNDIDIEQSSIPQ